MTTPTTVSTPTVMYRYRKYIIVNAAPISALEWRLVFPRRPSTHRFHNSFRTYMATNMDIVSIGNASMANPACG